MHLEVIDVFDLVQKPLRVQQVSAHRNVIFIELLTGRILKISFKFYKGRYAQGQNYIEGKARYAKFSTAYFRKRLSVESLIHSKKLLDQLE